MHKFCHTQFLLLICPFDCSLFLSVLGIANLICRQELFSVECQLLQNALDYQRHVTCIQDWQRKRDSLGTAAKSSQDLVSHDRHVTHDANSPTTLSAKDHELQLLLGKPHPHLTTSISPDSGTDVGVAGNDDNLVTEPEEVSASREEVATLVAEKQRLEARHKRLQRQLQDAKTKMAAVKEVG